MLYNCLIQIILSTTFRIYSIIKYDLYSAKLNKCKTWRILEVQKYCSKKPFWTEIVFKKQSCLKNSKEFVVSLTV